LASTRDGEAQRAFDVRAHLSAEVVAEIVAAVVRGDVKKADVCNKGLRKTKGDKGDSVPNYKRVGVVLSGSPATGDHFATALWDGLHVLGWIERGPSACGRDKRRLIATVSHP
jgi:hypothetical protein